MHQTHCVSGRSSTDNSPSALLNHLPLQSVPKNPHAVGCSYYALLTPSCIDPLRWFFSQRHRSWKRRHSRFEARILDLLLWIWYFQLFTMVIIPLELAGLVEIRAWALSLLLLGIVSVELLENLRCGFLSAVRERQLRRWDGNEAHFWATWWRWRRWHHPLSVSTVVSTSICSIIVKARKSFI